MIPQLAKKYRVVAPDLLGHGQSDKPRGDYSLGAFAVWLRDLLDELGVTRATIVGQSLGGGVAMQFVYQHPDYCERLVLISSGGLGPDVGWTLRLLSAPGAELIMPIIAPPPVLKIGNELRSVVDYRGQAVSALNRLHVASELPIMAIWGDQDQIIPVAHAYAAHEARPESRLEVLEGVGHFPQVERPAEVVDLLEDFITSTKQTATEPADTSRTAVPPPPD
jgi:pimeloyl-ACP methyl ester carboxylesterase